MSGTSVDAIDAALVQIDTMGHITLVQHHEHPWPEALQKELRDLPSHPPPRWSDWMRLDRQVAEEHAKAVSGLLRRTSARPRAIGFHGQTIFHAPDEANTLQIGSPAHLSALSGLSVIADLRRADMSRGGQGAPLAPFFHAALFKEPTAKRGVLNLGGIANLTVLGANGAEAGFDCGPANALMDDWAQNQLGLRFDCNGDIARKGRVDTSLMTRLLDDPFFGLPSPKSTGREYFSSAWLASKLDGTESTLDVMRTLLELTAVTICNAARTYALNEVIVAGGGARNSLLMQRLAELLAPASLRRTSDFGWPDQAIEAGLTAWLAAQHLRGIPLHGQHLTGANAPAIAGAHYPA